MTDVGNDHCDAAANIAECDYDEGDCCPRKDNGCEDCLCYKPFNKTGTIVWSTEGRRFLTFGFPFGCQRSMQPKAEGLAEG